MDSDIIDLDVLVPPNKIIRIGKEDIEVPPPKTVDLLQLGFLVERLADPSERTDAEVQKILDELTMRIYKCIPALQGKEFNKAQLQKIVDILSDMARPDSTRALDAQGLTADAQKKVPQG